ncbi:MAG: hypothetical protein AB1529_04990 [Candidatus Micrarchaeota archaeon]
MAGERSKRKKEADGPKRPFDKAAEPLVQSRQTGHVTSSELVRRLSALGKNWDAELERLLGIPPMMLVSSGGAAQYYSSDADFSISSIVLSLVHNAPLPRNTEAFGIALMETANNTYIVIADMKRRVIVKKRLMSIQAEASLDWAEVKSELKSALARAGQEDAKKEGLVAVYDSSLRTMRMAEPKAPVGLEGITAWSPGKPV